MARIRVGLVKVYFTVEEKAEVASTAKRLGLSSSDFIRNIITNTRLPEPETKRDILSLLKINADLARLGNLFHMAMDEKNLPMARLERMVAEIRETQSLLKEMVKSLAG